MTMTLIRTLDEASRGTFDPADVLIIMGYIVLSELPTILSGCLFIAVLSVLTRMFRDGEMVIWFGSGRGLASILKPLFRFAWPILVIILALAFFILPWAFGRIEDLHDKYEKRGDIARIEPGRFQESADGDRVFFIAKNISEWRVGNNVFIATREQDKETITSAQTGRIDLIGTDKFLILENGQRLERTRSKPDVAVSRFETYGARIGADGRSQRDSKPTNSMTTLELLQTPVTRHLAELSWRVGLILVAFNFLIIGLAAAGVNPRVGRASNLGVAFLAFIIYFNMLILGKNWIETEQVSFAVYLMALHGGTLAIGLIWVAKRHNNWNLRRPRA